MRKLVLLALAVALAAGCSKNPEKTVLAKVGNKEITLAQFNAELAQVPEKYKKQFLQDKEAFLDELIVREVLRQEAERQFGPLDSTAAAAQSDTAHTMNPAWFQRINEVMKNATDTVKVSLDEARDFYNKRNAEMGGRSFGEMAPMIQAYLKRQKQQVLAAAYVDTLKAHAVIWKNQKIIDKWNAELENPIRDALKEGKPVAALFVVSDFAPSMQAWSDLQTVLGGKEDQVKPVLVDLKQMPYLGRRYKIMQVPTLIVLDKEGKELARKVGATSTDQLAETLKEAGIEVTFQPADTTASSAAAKKQ